MTAHLSADQFARYLARTLTRAELLTVHDHLETCPDCRATLAEAALAQQTSVAIPLLADFRSAHLLEDEMTAFVAGRMPQPELVAATAHLAECAECRDSVAAMESVRSEAAVSPIRRRRPAPNWISTAGSAAAILLISALLYFRAAETRRTSSVPIVASLKDAGRTIDLSADGTLHGLPAVTPEELTWVRDALEQGILPAGPHIFADSPGTLRAPGGSSKPEFSLTRPLNTTVLADRPDFVWEPGRDVTAYEVVVTNEALEPLARSGRIQMTHWQPDTGLPRGVILLWQVRAWRGETMVSVPAPPAPAARFEIAGQDAAGRIAQLRASAHPSHLLIAILCAHEGLQAEEAKELQILAAENPGLKLR